MPDLSGLSLSDTMALGAKLRGLGPGCTSMEQAANAVAETLYKELVDRSGNGALAMARVYKTQRYGELDASLQAFARSVVGGRELASDTACLVLLATRGEDSAWNDRHKSSGHKAIPLPDPEFIARLPMVAEVLRQLGIDVSDVIKPNPAKLAEIERKQCDVFLVPKAEGSPFIPAQKDFVIPHAVESVVAFGGGFPRGEIFVALLFSKVAIDRPTANLFGPLALSVKLSLLPFFAKTIFTPGAGAQ